MNSNRIDERRPSVAEAHRPRPAQERQHGSSDPVGRALGDVDPVRALSGCLLTVRVASC